MDNFNSTPSAESVPESATLQSLLDRERQAAVTQWTLLNEMRLHGELPKWVLTNFPDAGTHAQVEKQRESERLVNKALLGEPVPCQYGLGSDMEGVFYLRSNGSGDVVFQGSAVDLALQPGVMEQLTERQLTAIACGLRDCAESMEVANG